MAVTLLVASILLSQASPLSVSAQQTGPQVPAEYAQLYSILQSQLDNYSAQLAGIDLPQSTIQQATTNSTSTSAGSNWSIPGFSLESIFVGLAVGFAVLYVNFRRTGHHQFCTSAESSRLAN